MKNQANYTPVGFKTKAVLEAQVKEQTQQIISTNEKVKTVACRRESKKGCHGKSSKCITHDLWDDLENHINNFFKKNTLGDIVHNMKKNKLSEIIK